MTDRVALLLRRAGFGPTADELAGGRSAGFDATLAALVAPPGPDVGAGSAPIPDLGPDPYAGRPNPGQPQRDVADNQRRQQTDQLTRWWLDRMTVADHQLAEKLLFFWHGHWATSVTKVKSAQLMLTQHRALRDARDFAEMAHRMVVDPALVHWLDGQLNTREAPNENLARELCELFTLGIGRYSEADVKQAGRALTGWRIDLGAQSTVLDQRAFDAGSKTILGETANFTAHSLVDLLLRQRACPRFVAARLWYRFGSSSEPVPEPLQEAMAAAFPSPTAMLRVLFDSDAFTNTAAVMVKQPIEWLVGAMRQLGLRPATMPADTLIQIVDGLAGMGQRPFAPRSVGGWPAGASWLTSAAANIRLSLAGKLAAAAIDGKVKLEDVGNLLAVDHWTDRTYAVLRDVSNSRLLITLGLISPEYLVT